MFSKVKEVHAGFMNLEFSEKKNLFFIGMTLFSLFFSYPLMRSVTTSYLISNLGAKASPYAWVFSVLALSMAVSLLNKFQKKVSAQKIFLGSVAFTVIGFIILFLGFKYQGDFWTYPLYVFKEVYIVLLVHQVLGHINASITESVAKLVYGPLGAIGSVGGILGGLGTTTLVKSIGENALFFIAVVIIASTIYFFSQTNNKNTHLKEAKERSPIKSIEGIVPFVLLISFMVLLSQFIINIGNYKFNLYLDNSFTSSIERTAFLGKIYASINTFSLLTQVFVLPIFLHYLPVSFGLAVIPIVYGLAYFGGLMIFGGGIMPLAITFIIFKGLDYSLFGAVKELLYYALSDIQKYGAKYVADMITYRLAKGLISLILIKLPVNLINSLLGVCLGAWLLCLIPLIKNYKKYHKRLEAEL